MRALLTRLEDSLDWRLTYLLDDGPFVVRVSPSELRWALGNRGHQDPDYELVAECYDDYVDRRGGEKGGSPHS